MELKSGRLTGRKNKSCDGAWKRDSASLMIGKGYRRVRLNVHPLTKGKLAQSAERLHLIASAFILREVVGSIPSFSTMRGVAE